MDASLGGDCVRCVAAPCMDVTTPHAPRRGQMSMSLTERTLRCCPRTSSFGFDRGYLVHRCDVKEGAMGVPPGSPATAFRLLTHRATPAGACFHLTPFAALFPRRRTTAGGGWAAGGAASAELQDQL